MINTEVSSYYPGTNTWLPTSIDLNEKFFNCTDIFFSIFKTLSTKDQCQLRLVSKAWAAVMPVTYLLSAEAAPTPLNFVNLFFKKADFPLKLSTDRNPVFTPLMDFYDSIHFVNMSLKETETALSCLPEEVPQARFLLKLLIPIFDHTDLEIFKDATTEKKVFSLECNDLTGSKLRSDPDLIMPFFCSYLRSLKQTLKVAEFSSSFPLFSPSGLRLVLTSLMGFEKIEKLKLNNPFHDEENFRLFIKLTVSLKNLKEIHLFKHGLDEHDIDRLIEELPQRIGFVIVVSNGCISRAASNLTPSELDSASAD